MTCAALLRNVKVKVNAVLRQKHMPEAYDLRIPEGEGGDAEAHASARSERHGVIVSTELAQTVFREFEKP